MIRGESEARQMFGMKSLAVKPNREELMAALPPELIT
jgi:hypothetical protein